MKNTNWISNTALLIGFTLMLLALINGFAVVEYVKHSEQMEDKYSYRYIYRATLHDEDLDINRYNDFFSSLNDLPSNRGLNVGVYLGEDRVDVADYTVLRIYYDCKLPLLQNMMSGELPDGSEGEPAVAIGCANDKYTYEKEGKKYITLNGVELLVTGIIGLYNMDIQDDIIYATPDSLGEMAQKQIMEPSVNTIGSMLYLEVFEETDEETSVFYTVDEEYKYMPEQKNMFGISEGTIVAYDHMYKYKGQREDNEYIQMLFWVLALFAGMGSITLSGLWFGAHKKEMAVRKLWGYSNVQLGLNILKKMGLLSVVSIVMAFVIQIPITLIWRDGFDLFGFLNFSQVAKVVGIMVAMTFIITVIELDRSRKLMPADALRKYEY